MLNFIINNQNEIIFLGVLAAILLSAKYLIPFLKKKNIITDEIMLDAAHVMNIAETLVRLINVDSKVKDNAVTIFEACRKAFAYTSDVMNVTDLEQKKKITYDAVIETLTRLGVEIDDHKKNLINLGIDYAIVKSIDK